MKKTEEFLKWMGNNFDLLLIAGTVVTSAVISILDITGILVTNDKTIPYLTLVLISSIAIYLVIERRKNLETPQKEMTENLKLVLNQLEMSRQNSSDGVTELKREQNEQTKQLIDALDGVHIKVFPDEMKCVEYATNRILEAETEVDDTSWAPKFGFSSGRDKNLTIGKRHWDSTLQALDKKEKLVFREIFVFNDKSRLEKLMTRFKENRPGYYCVYYDKPSTPLLQFMIIDDIEVIIMTDQYPTYLAIRNKLLATLFKQYYEDLWQKAKPIKTTRSFLPEIVEEIQTKHKKLLGQ